MPGNSNSDGSDRCVNPTEVAAAAGPGAVIGAILGGTAGLAAPEIAAIEGVASRETAVGGVPASTPVGRSGNPIDVKPGTNQPGSVGGRDYIGHAFGQMQGRGIPIRRRECDSERRPRAW
jgi:hypothetical protein